MNAILSIKPQYVEEIMAGTKKYEYRKSVFKRPVKKVYIYASAPVSMIIGEFEVAQILESTPTLVWQQTKDFSGIKKAWFDQYYAGRNTAYAIGIKNLYIYSTPMVLTCPAPQSFCYTDK